MTLDDPALGFFRTVDVEKAPQSPGLYAWYGVLREGRRTCEDPAALKAALVVHSERYQLQALRVWASGPFARWTGELGDATRANRIAGRQVDTKPDPDEENLVPSLEPAMGSVSAREHLVLVLEKAIPALTAPLYIGRARNLRDRLRQHVRALEKSTAGARTFAARAKSLGFSEESLAVQTVDFAVLLRQTGLAPDQADREARELIKTAEWLLNRWHRPQVGKR